MTKGFTYKFEFVHFIQYIKVLLPAFSGSSTLVLQKPRSPGFEAVILYSFVFEVHSKLIRLEEWIFIVISYYVFIFVYIYNSPCTINR